MVGILLISTRLYKKFVPPLLSQIDELFLPDYPKTIFLFTDEVQRGLPHLKNEVRQIIIPSYGWPYASLYRYSVFNNNANALRECSHLAYLDADMAVVAEVLDEILCDGLSVVLHPGFYSRSEEIGHWGSNGVVKESLAYVEPEKRNRYVAGGFNAGRTEEYLWMAKELSENIKDDENRKVMAEYHDESHTNAFVKNVYNGEIKYLTPEYCMPEQKILQERWGLSHLTPRIIALEKKHSEIRQ